MLSACRQTFDWSGDEFLHAQYGNNNAYNKDNETSWLDWSRLEANWDIFRFFQQMIAFRKAHRTLGRSRFWRNDIHWYGTGTDVDMTHESRALAFCLHGASQGCVDMYVLINASCKDSTFTVQEGAVGDWQRVIDTSRESPDDFCDPGMEVALTEPAYVVKRRSVVVLVQANSNKEH